MAMFCIILSIMIKVFGHKSPDTDATGSAILWAWYLNTHTPSEATPYILGTLNKETVFVLDKWNIAEPEVLNSVEESDEITIVDTNNPQELFGNISETQIKKIIDHHRLSGGLSTKTPVDITIKPLASTATVIHDIMEDEHIDTMPENMTGLMMSCILSDTLAFRSPTTTPHDKDVVEKLAKKLGINIEEYSNEMFAAKSDVSDFSDSRIVRLDSKKVDIGDKTIRISVIETTTPDQVLKRKDKIVNAIKEIIAEEKIDDILFFIIDIFKEEATAFTYNKFISDLVSKSFNVEVESDTEILPGILSRKKQILPALKLP